MAKKKATHGGPREGAGRPVEREGAKKVSVKLDAWVWQWFEKQAKASNGAKTPHQLHVEALTEAARAGGASPPKA